MSFLSWIEANAWAASWFTLTSAPESERGSLGRHHARLLRRIERDYRYPRIEFVVVETREGLGVLHGIWAIPGRAAGGLRSCYVEKRFRSAEWSRLHGAAGVSINEYHHGHYQGGASKVKLSRYAVAQYIKGQRAIVRSWSRTPSLGVPIRKTWRWLKRQLGKGDGLKAWNTLLTGGTVVLQGQTITLRSMAEDRRSLRLLRAQLRTSADSGVVLPEWLSDYDPGVDEPGMHG